MWVKRIQLGLIHTAVAITLVPFTSTLNGVMIQRLGISATFVTILVTLPYFFSPMQIAIGSYADRNPILGRRRTPYILFGLILCVLGVFLAPTTAFELESAGPADIIVSLITFSLWGMGYNFAAVSYLSLASELDEKGRSVTIATMFFVMVLGIIFTAIFVARMVEPYSDAALIRAFNAVGIAALVMGLLALIKLEPHFEDKSLGAVEQRYTLTDMGKAVFGNPQARLFFIYLILMLSAILGQNVVLEPYAAEAFAMSEAQYTRITAIWGTAMLLTLVIAGALQNRFTKKTVAAWGAWIAIAGFALIALSGPINNTGIFWAGVVLLGLGTGLSTVSNISLMLDMTTLGNVGLFVGAWGMANALARLVGQLLSGVVRDILNAFMPDPVWPYVIVFLVELGFLAISLIMLRSISVNTFQTEADDKMTLTDTAALLGMSDAGG